MKSHLRQFDVAFIYSFNQAEKFGAWEVSSNQALVQAGFNGWKRNHVGIRTRAAGSEGMYTKRPKTERYRKSLTYKGSKMWNQLPADIQNLALQLT